MIKWVAAWVSVVAAGHCMAGDPSYDTLIAHRGESVDAPENTLPAYKTAVERGFGFECDIFMSKDGRIFTCHGDLERITEGAVTNRVTDLTWDELSKINVADNAKWRDSRFNPTHIALLDEVLELARDGRYIYVEVKGHKPEWVPQIKEVFARQRNASPKNVLFISFGREVCAELKRLMPEYKVFWLTTAKVRPSPGAPKVPVSAKYIVDVLRETGADGVDCEYVGGLTTAKIIDEVKSAGYEFHVWTVDDYDDAVEAFRRGVQSVTTNCAKDLLDWHNARKAAAARAARGSDPCDTVDVIRSN